MSDAVYKRFRDGHSLIGEYMRFMDAQETAIAYDFWSMVWLIGYTMRRNFIIDRPRAPVWSNWYTVFVAESGITRKTTAVKCVAKIAQHMNKYPGTAISFLQGKATAEALAFDMMKSSQSNNYGHAAIVANELVTVLGREAYLANMPGFLTDMYDCPEYFTNNTIKKGGFYARDVWLSFLSASTPAWLLRAISPDTIEGGFTSRCIFVHSEDPKRKIPWPAEEDGETLAAFGNKLRERRSEILQQLPRTKSVPDAAAYQFSPGGMKRYETWYVNRRAEKGPYASSFESREDSHVLRMAMCLAFAENSPIINDYHVDNAIAVMKKVKGDGDTLFAGLGFQSNTIRGLDKMRSLLIEGGMTGIPQSRLTVRLKGMMNAAQIAAATDILHEMGMIQIFESSTRGRPLRMIRATPALTDEKEFNNALKLITPDEIPD